LGLVNPFEIQEAGSKLMEQLHLCEEEEESFKLAIGQPWV